MLPKSLVLWPTTDCNLRCVYCYSSGGKTKQYMDFETAKLAIDKMGEGPIKIQFAGGEPSLNMDLIEKVCEYLTDRDNINFSLQTNGTLIDDRFIKIVKKYGISLGISLDGIYEINELQRGQTKKVIEGINRLKEEGIFVNINAVVTEQSIDYLPKLYDILFVMGNINGMALDLLRKVGRACNGYSKPPTLKQAQEIMYKLYDHSRDMEKVFGKKLIIRELEDARYRLNNTMEMCAYCYAEIGRSFVLTPMGEVYPCGSFVGDDKKLMGNVYDIDNLKPICLKRPIKKECINCEFNKYCVGVCPARMILDDNFLIDCAIKYSSFKIAQKEIDRRNRYEKEN